MPKAWMRPRSPSGTNSMPVPAQRHDARQEYFAASPLRELDQRGGIQLVWQRGVQPDALARREPAGGGDVARDGGRGLGTRGCRQRTRRALRERRRGASWSRREGRKSATRECRCESLLSNQSNKVGPALTFKAFRTKRTCTVLSARLSPGVYITVERNPTRYRTPQAAQGELYYIEGVGMCGYRAKSSRGPSGLLNREVHLKISARLANVA